MATDNHQVRSTDLVLLKMSLRGRDTNEVVELDEKIPVSELRFTSDADASDDDDGADRSLLSFDAQKFAELMASGDERKVEEALRMQAELLNNTATYMSQGGRPETERLADALVDWVVRTAPGGNKFVTERDSDEGYIINKDELNIRGPITLGSGDDSLRVWKAEPVATWG